MIFNNNKGVNFSHEFCASGNNFIDIALHNRKKLLQQGPEYILSLETSCDETAAAVITENKNSPELISSQVASQIDAHEKFGGVVPEIASRRHLELIETVIEKAVDEAGITFEQITAITATQGPGLVGALLVGFAAGKALAYAQKVPFIAANHVAGHIYANFLVHDNIETPFVCLTVSGGHTDLLYFSNKTDYKILGRTRDDAAGEAFDKIARFLDLGYPGGPEIENIAKKGDPDNVELPRALDDKKTYDFSFSGLKTAVINYVHNARQREENVNISDLAASFQQAVVESLIPQVERAVKEHNPHSLLLAGGVAANSLLRERFSELADRNGIPLYLPPLELCTDNAAMIGAAAFYRLQSEEVDNLAAEVKPTLTM